MSGIHEPRVEGVPAHVASWSVAGIPKFIPSVLERWRREFGPLPEGFCLLACPQVEINAAGGLPDTVRELTDPVLRCRHFTGCHRPYFVVLFLGPEALDRCRQAQARLAWSESYRVRLTEAALVLDFLDATEDLDDDGPSCGGSRLKELLANGEIVNILA